MSVQPSFISDCSAYDPSYAQYTAYDYQPSLAAGVIFTTLFGLSALLHAYQTWRTRRFWQIAFVAGGIGECLGWLARAIAWRCPYSATYFEMQISLLIFSPAFITAGIYTILVFLIPILGSHTSPIPRKLYLWIFMIIDFISLLLQAIGGGLASSAAGDGENPVVGTNIMIAGIIFQLVSLVVFTGLMGLVLFRGWKVVRSDKNLMIISSATILSVTCVVIRGIYRSIELLQGWTGYLITNERFALALDGGMIILAVVIFNVFNPGYLFKKVDVQTQPPKLEQASDSKQELQQDV